MTKAVERSITPSKASEPSAGKTTGTLDRQEATGKAALDSAAQPDRATVEGENSTARTEDKQQPRSLQASSALDRASPSIDFIPSVAALAAWHREMWRVAHQHDTRWVDKKSDPAQKEAAHAAHLSAIDIAEAIDELIFTRPIQTLPDALAISVHGFVRCDRADEAEHLDWQTIAMTFARLSVVLSGLANVPLEDLGSGGVADTIRRRAAHRGAN